MMDPNAASDAVDPSSSQSPRSRRVQGKPSLPSLTTPTTSSSPPPPILPTRSPLRPPARSISSTPLTTTTFAASGSGSPASVSASTSTSSLPSRAQDDITHEREDELDRTLTRHSLALASAVAAAANSDTTTTITSEESSLPPISTTASVAAQMSLMRERHNSFPTIDNLIEAINADFEGFGLGEGSSKEREYARRQVDGTERERQRESSILTWEPSYMEAEGEGEDGIVKNEKVQQQKHQLLDLTSLSMRYLSINKDKSLPPRPLDVERREGEGREETEMESPVSLVDMETEDGGAGIGRPVNKGSSNATTTATTTTSNRSSANSDGADTTSSMNSSSSSSSAASTANTSITTPPASASSLQPQGQTQTPPVPQQPPQPPPMTKRQHALHELLSSERAYASDLALLREVHIPLALGQTAPIHATPTTATPPASISTSSQSAHHHHQQQQSLSNGGTSSAHNVNSNSNAASGSGSNNSSRAVSTFSTSSDPATTTASTGAVSGPIHTIIQAQRISTSSSSSSSLSGGSTTNNNHNISININNSSVSSLPASISPSISSSLSSLGNAGSEIWSLGPPMTQEDVKIIFGNISDLAMLSDMLCEELERALGNVLEGGVGEDYVGALFLRVTREFEKPYKQYITRHSTALQHLQNLPQTPALQAYLSYTQSVASSVSHAWDLASLLIKPVQRLLKYPLLLNAILEETPKEHGDKDNLRLAREKIEELARDVNEGRRRAEVVKDVLSASGTSGLLGGLKGAGGRKGSASAGGGGGSGGSGSGVGVQHPVGVAASVNLSKVKSLKYGGVTAATMRAESTGVADATSGGVVGGNAEAALVDAMAGELKRMEVFAQQFAKNVVDWGKMMSNVTLALRTWALSFGKVIGLSSEHGLGSEAFDAFVEVIKKGLMPLTADLEAAINERLLRDLAHLLTTMNKPLKLLASMSEQEPYHYHLLTMPVSSKNRPPASLLAASTNYLALRGQLAAELPIYLKLMHTGFAVIVRRLAEVQVRFWRDVKERWADLWEMLRVEGELNVGWEETCAVWCMRWGDVDELVAALGIMQNPVVHIEKAKHQMMLQGLENQYFAYPNYYVPMAAGYPTSSPPMAIPIPSPPKEQHHKLEKKTSKSSSSSGGRKQSIPTSTSSGANAAAAVQSMFAALEPAHSPALQRTKQQTVGGIHGNGSLFSVSAPLPLGSVAAHGKDGRRGRVSDATIPSSSTDRDRRTSSQDSAHSRQRTSSSRDVQRRRTQGHNGMADEYAEYVAMHGGVMPPPYENGHYPYGNGKGVTRMKSMPLSAGSRNNNNNNGHSDDSERAYHHYQQEGWEEYPESTSTVRPSPRGRLSQDVLIKSSPSAKRKSKERPTHERKRSGSVKSITSFFTGSSNTVNEPAPVDPQPLTASQRDSWVSKPAKYVCQVVHPCRPPAQVSYYSFPFFVLKEGDLYEVLQEAGHPSIHPKLPLYVDDGVDCLLLCRDGNGVVGWALASFLEPLNLGI